MLMFENGLLASFIPEILMVLGFLFCLIFPGLKTEKSTENLPSKVFQATSTQHTQQSVYNYSNYKSQPLQAIENEQISQVRSVFKILHPLIQPTFKTKDGQFQVHFSRPPPTF